MVKDLSPAQCILLTVHYASSANIQALHSFTPARPDALQPELILRILLTYLPESTEPREYTTYISEVSSRLYLDVERKDVEVDLSPVKDLTEEQAQQKVQKLRLLKLRAPGFPAHGPKDTLTRFLCHRAYRIDSETGLLNLVPPLVEPFIERNEFLRSWYISLVLPLTRYQFEYYPDAEDLAPKTLIEFENMAAPAAIDFLLQGAIQQERSTSADQSRNESNYTISRDAKGLVGPWMYGYTERKRRKLGHARSPRPRQETASGPETDDSSDDDEDLADGVRKIALTGVTEDDITGHDWEDMFKWLVMHARDDFAIASHCIEDWNGPGDVDLGGFVEDQRDYLNTDVQQKLELQFAQAGFASCYAAQADTRETIKCAHSVLARLAEILDFIPPPDLATSVDLLPKIERHATVLEKRDNIDDLDPENLLKPNHPLTSPLMESYMLLQLMVYSAYQFSGLGHPLSLVNVARLHFYSSPDEQVEVIRKILRGLAKSGARKDDSQWEADRAKLIWLWNWGMDIEDENATTGAGVLGKIDKSIFEEELLKVFTDTASYDLAIKHFMRASQQDKTKLSREQISKIVLNKAMEAYDSASNGNKTRGGVKRANEILSAYRSEFPGDIAFSEATSLIAATHSLSFYSLTLQHGVPFQPVSIRVNQDPIGLIDKVLEQNPRSYTKLDDLIDIAKNLVSAGLHGEKSEKEEIVTEWKKDTLELRRREAGRRVTFMAVQAALREEDFETAYSYIVNRLTPSGADITAPNNADSSKKHSRNASKASVRSMKDSHEDDISWRAAFLAGRYRPATTSPPTLRRLEQRTELLSLALLLAPKSALTEILAAWRRCEEETTSLHLAQQQAEQEFDDRATFRQGGSSALPGNFTVGHEGPDLILNQKRREVGRMVSSGAADEAPVSMFDLTRSAARAFSQGAFPLRGAGAPATRPSVDTERSLDASRESLDGDGRSTVRKRDMVANAVSGGLASGLGWMLGATPVNHGEQHE